MRTKEKRPSYSAFAMSAIGPRLRSRPNHPSCSAFAKATADKAVNAAMTNTATMAVLRQADDTPVPPLRAEQADEQQQDDRHVPEIVLFDGGDTASRVAQVVGERRRARRRVEASAGLVSDPAQRAGVHGRVEILRVAGRGAEMGDG